jgi:hypothetical protein
MYENGDWETTVRWKDELKSLSLLKSKLPAGGALRFNQF